MLLCLEGGADPDQAGDGLVGYVQMSPARAGVTLVSVPRARWALVLDRTTEQKWVLPG